MLLTLSFTMKTKCMVSIFQTSPAVLVPDLYKMSKIGIEIHAEVSIEYMTRTIRMSLLMKIFSSISYLKFLKCVFTFCIYRDKIICLIAFFIIYSFIILFLLFPQYFVILSYSIIFDL